MKNIINMSGMFLGCRRLKKIDFPELDNKISKDMSYMFTGCFEINDIGGLLGYDISNDTWSLDNKTLNGLKKCNFRINNGIIEKSKKKNKNMNEMRFKRHMTDFPVCTGLLCFCAGQEL